MSERRVLNLLRGGAGGLLLAFGQASGSGLSAADIRLDPIVSIALEGAEIPAFDPATGAIFVTHAEGLARIAEPARSCDAVILDPLQGMTGEITHVAIDPRGRGVGIVTVVAERADRPGWVVAFSTRSGAALQRVEVGCHPDSAAFSPDGRWLVVANEGEPDTSVSSRLVDPPGSVTVIDVGWCLGAADFSRLGSYDCREVALDLSVGCIEGIRIHPGAWSDPAADLEPEYVVAANDTAWVTLQENNAIASIDLASATCTGIHGLGRYPLVLDGRPDGRASIETRIDGMPMPDQMAMFVHDGRHYLVTADEGDTRGRIGRDEGVVDVARLGELRSSGRLATGLWNLPDELIVCAFTGDEDADGVIEAPVVLGTRSVSVWDALAMDRVGETSAEFERSVARSMPHRFNADSHAVRHIDVRSDNRGPEPEGVIIAELDGRQIAFVTLERPGAIAIVDVSNPTSPRLIRVVDTTQDDGRGPEGMAFIPRTAGLFQQDALVVAFEVSGRLAIYAIGTAAASK